MKKALRGRADNLLAQLLLEWAGLHHGHEFVGTQHRMVRLSRSHPLIVKKAKVDQTQVGSPGQIRGLRDANS